MKKGLVFLLGAITGIVLTFVFFFILGLATSGSRVDGVDYFEEVGQVMSVQEYKVMQVLPNGNALATELSNEEYDWYHGAVVLLVAGDDVHYYDEQVKSSRNQKAADSGKLAHIGTKPSKDLSRPFLQSPLYVSMATYTARCHLWLKKT